jgi:hypothetical protein
MNTDSQISILEQYDPPPSKVSGLLAVYTTLITRNVEFPPEQVCGNKDQFKASVSYQFLENRVKTMSLNISPPIM